MSKTFILNLYYNIKRGKNKQKRIIFYFWPERLFAGNFFRYYCKNTKETLPRQRLFYITKSYRRSAISSKSFSVFSQPRHGSVMDFPYTQPSGFWLPSSMYDSIISPLTSL